MAKKIAETKKKTKKSSIKLKGTSKKSAKTKFKNKLKKNTKSSKSSKPSSSTSIEDLIKLEESIEARAKAKKKTRVAFDRSKLAVEIATETLLSGGGDNGNNNNITDSSTLNTNNYNLSSIDVFEESLASFQKSNNTRQQQQPTQQQQRSQSPLSSTISMLNNNPYYGIGLSTTTTRTNNSSSSTTTTTNNNNNNSNVINNKKKKTTTMTTRKNKKMTASQQRKRSHFHYLGGSVSLQAERERRMELEERLIDAREEVRKQAQTLQPTVEALVGAVRAIEQGADEQLLLADQTQQTFESLHNEISTLRHELKKDIRKSKDHSRKELDNYKKKMEETMQNDREKYTKQINSLKAELALLRSEFVAHRDTVKERLDVIPESFEEMKNLYQSGVTPLEVSIKMLREKVDSMDKTMFNIDKAQLKMRLAMRSNGGGSGYNDQQKNHSAAARDKNGKLMLSGDPTISGGPMQEAQPWEISRDIKALRKEISILKATVSDGNSHLRQRLEDGASRIRGTVERVDQHHAEYSAAIGELQQLLSRATTIVRNESRDMVYNLRNELLHEIKKMDNIGGSRRGIGEEPEAKA